MADGFGDADYVANLAVGILGEGRGVLGRGLDHTGVLQVSHLFEYVDFDTPYSQVSFDELKSEFLKLKEKSNG